VTLADGTRLNRMLELLPLTQDKSKALGFLGNIDFSSKIDTDDWTAMYYGLSEALKKGGFVEGETNIIFSIGSFGDFRANKPRKDDAKSTRNPALFEDTSVLLESMAQFDINMYAFQLRDNQLSASKAFTSGMYRLILDSAKIPYNKRYANPANANVQKLLEQLKKDKVEVKEPTMTDPDGNESILVLSNAVHPGFILRPSAGKSIAKANLKESILKGMGQSVNFADNFYDILTRMYSSIGTSYSQAVEKVYQDFTDESAPLGYFNPAFAQFLEQNLNDVGREELLKSTGNKYHLYSKVFVPARINGAKFPSVSYCLCMPEQDLLQYKNTIELCLRTSTSATGEKRRSLYEVYRMLYDQFSGEQSSKKSFESLETTDILLMMQGLSDKSDDLKAILKLDLPVVKLKEILDERKVSNAEIDRLMKRFADVNSRLEAILRSPRYEFKFGNNDKDDDSRSLNVIYWIPMKDVF
jgi:hypothetical protein